MTKCLCLINNKWVERLYPKFSKEEKKVLDDDSSSNDEKRSKVIKAFNERGSEPASLEDIKIAQEVYDKNKVVGSELIIANIILPGLHGSINCKVGNNYKVVRF
jgi:hypothetical protein